MTKKYYVNNGKIEEIDVINSGGGKQVNGKWVDMFVTFHRNGDKKITYEIKNGRARNVFDTLEAARLWHNELKNKNIT